MFRIGKLFAMPVALMIAPVMLSAATVTISVVRVDLSDAIWDQYTSSIEQYEAILEGEDGDFTYGIEHDENSIDFIYTFPEGWDYYFVNTWRTQTIPQLNQSLDEANAGWRWRVTVDGEISGDSNPWNEVDWLADVAVVDADHLWARGLGWLYASNWSAEGNFWAYAYNLAWNWLYVYGYGYYYSADEGAWVFNYPGSRWFYHYGQEGWVELDEQDWQ